jgi:hypothetical protein
MISSASPATWASKASSRRGAILPMAQGSAGIGCNNDGGWIGGTLQLAIEAGQHGARLPGPVNNLFRAQQRQQGINFKLDRAEGRQLAAFLFRYVPPV